MGEQVDIVPPAGAELRFRVVSGDRRTNELMRMFDLREEGKIFATDCIVTTKVADGCPSIRSVFDSLKAGLDEDREIVLLEYLGMRIGDGEWVQNAELEYYDDSFTQISDGRHIVSIVDKEETKPSD